MTLLLQDAIATSLALGALVILVQRIASVVRPSGPPPACAACPSACDAGKPARDSGARTIVPLAVLRQGRAPKPGAPGPRPGGIQPKPF